jgi:hypothetical protein
VPGQSLPNVSSHLFFCSKSALRARARDLLAPTCGNRSRVHLSGRARIQINQPQRSTQWRSAKIAAVGWRIPRCDVYLDQTHGRNDGAPTSATRRTPAALVIAPGATMRQDTEDNKFPANRRGLVIRRNHLAGLVSRGLASAAGGNISHGNLGLLHPGIIRARV